jgi:pSer/pThr/pTyr-binding forkhead associated (FHA) protein
MHARLRFNNGTWLIEDTESLNGLMYQGDRVEQLPLMNGDRVQLAPKVAVQYVPA